MAHHLKIAHFNNVAGVATTLAKYQKKAGDEATVMVKELHHFRYPQERVYYGNIRNTFHAIGGILSSDIVHFHDGPFLRRSRSLRTYLLDKLDYNTAKSVRKRIIFHFHGTSIRDPSARQRNSAFFNEKLLVATPDLFPFVPSHSVWAPHPVDTELFYPRRSNGNAQVVVGFYQPPTPWGQLWETPQMTLDVVTGLSAKEVKPSPAAGLPWAKMPSYFNEIDVWVDKMNLDFYGVSACEAAACGVPVVAHIGENERAFVPDCSFLQANYGTLSRTLEYLMEENTRKYVGQKCRDFVLKVHSASRICELIRRVYLN